MIDVIEAIPYARHLGVRVEAGECGLECVLPFREELIGNATLRAIHGGALGAFLELAALAGLIQANEGGPVPKPINFGIDYLRSARAVDTRARAEIVKIGRRVANVRVSAWQESASRPVAVGNGKFLF